jgi:hypothetical protein
MSASWRLDRRGVAHATRPGLYSALCGAQTVRPAPEQGSPCQQCLDVLASDPRAETRCWICEGPFTEEEWEDRHWLEDEPEAEVHARCCPVCEVEP